MPTEKKKKKAPIKKKGKKKVKKKGHISDSSFTHDELKKFMTTIKKLRKNKRGKKKKKIGLTNVTSFLNLLYNVDKEKQRKPRQNLMYAHPYKYPALIRDADVDKIWKATKIPSSKTPNAIVTNLNDVYRQLTGFQMLKPLPGKKLPKHQRGAISIKSHDDIKNDDQKNKGPYLQSTPVQSKSLKVKSRSDDSSSSSEDEDDVDVQTKKRK